MDILPPEALEQVAAYFQALAEPTRLLILNLLRNGECSVGELAERCACSSANVSRHLALLMRHGFVLREARGTSVYYRIADASVYALCDLVCGSIARQLDQRARSHAAFVEANAAALPPGAADRG
ncbi:ArsR/SmtB family transcription factor [Derxia lacustris]|uniref:ArsR/SmtB family transcription factor n=1 Tax=Derxia lacustris TaxID=764842 RepID=UPI000A172F3D|nr:metalloregulator ArsR/SmtB family transcription factor [Derxia lacustris]